ncbi:hypothetical protein SB717_15595 [Priestia sp. SIMBA_032]|uniref:hypothetical protein n=1 Tax=Priestia sp. SIMBA_032 TaxID=3085775 RepID=UPI00397C8240
MSEITKDSILAGTTVEVITLGARLDILMDALAEKNIIDKAELLDKFAKLSPEDKKERFYNLFGITLEEMLNSK